MQTHISKLYLKLMYKPLLKSFPGKGGKNPEIICTLLLISVPVQSP